MRDWIMALAATTLLGAPAAQAQVYLEARGGVSLLEDADIDGRGAPVIGSEIDFKPGFTASGALGYRLGAAAVRRWWLPSRVEVEGVFGKGNIDSVADELDGPRGSLSGDGGGMTVQGGLVNGLYDLASLRLGGLTPYVGAGVGGGKIDIDGGKPNSPDGIDDSETVFLYQARAGLGTRLTRHLTFSAGYRYLATPNDIRLRARGVAPFETEFRSHSFEVGLRYELY